MTLPFVWVLFGSPHPGGPSEGIFGWALGQILTLATLLAALALAVSGGVRLRQSQGHEHHGMESFGWVREARQRSAGRAGAQARLWTGVVVAVMAFPFAWVLFGSPHPGGPSEGIFGWALGQILTLATLLAALALAVSGGVRLRREDATMTDGPAR
jgi:hypothetical protein